MATVILVRHGEPTYDEVKSKGFLGIATAFGKLTEEGKKQAETRARLLVDENADLIISSPYTRSLQTASIISRVTSLPIEIQHDLHEWKPFMNPLYIGDAKSSYEEYMKNEGIKVENQKYDYEDIQTLRNRVYNALKPYLHLNKIIVVCHGLVMSSLTKYDDLIGFCDIRTIELT